MTTSNEPPWRARAVALIAVLAAIASMSRWGIGGFVAIAFVGLASAMAIWNWSTDSPDPFGIFALKMLTILVWGVALVWGVVLLVEWVEPFWLALVSAGAFLALNAVAANRVSQWEEQRDESRSA